MDVETQGVVDPPVWGGLAAGSPDGQPVERRRRRVDILRGPAGTLAPIAVLIIVSVIMHAGNPNFLTPYNLQAIATRASVLLVLGIGATVIILLGAIDLSIGGICSLSTVILARTIAPLQGWAFVLCLVMGALAGGVNGLLNTRGRIPSFIATLGTYGALSGAAYVVSNATPIEVDPSNWGILNWITSKSLGLGGGVWLALAVLVVAVVVERFSPFGRAVFAIGAGEQATRFSGINVDLFKIVAFMISGVCGSLAGILLVGQLYSGAANLGDPYLLLSITVVVMGGTALTGGIGSVLRTLIGVLIIVVIENGLDVLGINVFAQGIATGLIILAAVALTSGRSAFAVVK